MRWEQPEARPGRTAVVLLVVAIFAATALAIALVVGAASRSSLSSDGPEARSVAGAVVVASALQRVA